MKQKLLLEGIISVISLCNTTEAKGSDLQSMISLRPTTYSIELRLEPTNGLRLNCQSDYRRLEPNGLCSMEYKQRLGMGEIEVKGYKGLTDKGYYIGMRYRVEW